MMIIVCKIVKYGTEMEIKNLTTTKLFAGDLSELYNLRRLHNEIFDTTLHLFVL
jgi:hypothetical protein